MTVARSRKLRRQNANAFYFWQLSLLLSAPTDNLSQQIVLQYSRDPDDPKFAALNFPNLGIVDQANSIDFGSLRLEAALQQQIALLGRTFNQDREFFSDQFAVFSTGDGRLLLHQSCAGAVRPVLRRKPWIPSP